MSASPSLPSPHASGVLDWFQQIVEQPAAQLSTKLRGNILHVLCETSKVLEQNPVLLRLVRGLMDREQSIIAQAYPQIYQVYFYNRVAGEPQPRWTAPIYLNRLERHLAQLVLDSQDETERQATQALLENYADGDSQRLQGYTEDGAGGAIVLSNLSLARQGDPDAVAWYLSETLSALDVGVWVSIKAVPGKAHLHNQAVTALGKGTAGEAEISRLWVLCEAAYSPDPALIAQPTARRLRQLQLSQYQDAVLLLQVRGEARPDWSLRIDLTPAEEMLKEWGRWGDEDAIATLLHQALEPLQLAVSTEIKGETLHAVCQAAEAAPVPAWERVRDVIAPLLDTLGPQGLHQAVVYGQAAAAADPTWVNYLDLPGKEHEALAPSPEALARQGDQPAIAFLLVRLLNPSLDEHLETGGLRVQLLVRDRLLHVMVDGPVAPRRRQVVKPVVVLLDELDIDDIQGVRIYGRRSGQPQPEWSYGKDFQVRRRLVPEAAPEFAASEAYVNELLTAPEAAPEMPEAADAPAGGWLRRGMLRSHLFTPQQSVAELAASGEGSLTEGLKIAAVWSAVGLMLTLQLDWVLGQLMRPVMTPGAAEAVAPPPEDASFMEAFRDIRWGSESADTGDAGEEGFTSTEAGTIEVAPDSSETGEGGALLPTSPTQPQVSTDTLLATSPYPSFRSQQLNEKLALYYQRLEQSGPPDVMIVGSSRALRGVDPVALRQRLAALGYEDVSIFNFGVNGATAQVVDLTLRRILQPHQLPSMILWADGARAFNSGREDVTYNAIATSEGYRELVSGRLNVGGIVAEADSEAQGSQSLSHSYQDMDRQLSERLGDLSSAHDDREQLKTWLQQRLADIAEPLAIGRSAIDEQLDAPMPEGSRIDFDGFLALPLRFNPATYYQNHPRVLGRYDGDYEDFRLAGRQDEALRSLLAFTQEQEIPVVFVNTPLTDEYLDDYRQEAEAAFVQYMEELSASEVGFLFRDLAPAWTTRYDYFSDPSHLNRYGAYQVSQRLAEDPRVPWHQTRSETP